MSITVRPLAAADMPAAANINRAAFSAFFGIPDPAKFRTGADVVGPRWRLWPEAGVTVELDGELAGAALMMRWGSVCVLGPVTVAPAHWSKGLARNLMTRLVEVADRGNFAFTGLVTHPQSPKHVRLYESFGFRMHMMTGVMVKAAGTEPLPKNVALLSTLGPLERARALGAIRALCDSLFPGLDLSDEAAAVVQHKLGDTLLVGEPEAPDAFAVCHCGPGSEASAGQVFVKFAAARGGAGAAERFQCLLGACEGYAAARGAMQVVAGTNTGRAEAYELMQRAGYRTIMNTIAMMRPATEGYNKPGVFVIDDWR